MPANLNPRTTELLSWHGHTRGGVHVPFQAGANPLGQTIATGIVLKLRALAQQIAASADSSPRWVFLVGGPGNGKSETVQDFLVQLDAALGLNGALCHVLRARFTPNPILPRKVEVVASDLPANQAEFAAKVGRLIVVQDATATEMAGGNAARELALDVADLVTSSGGPLPVFIACANRGLLARAMNEAYREFSGTTEVTQVLTQVIRASSLGREALAGRPACWPLADHGKFACWPLDVESLTTVGGPSASPFEQMVIQAVAQPMWESAGRCADCSSRAVCPFRQNAEWLRDPATRQCLAHLLRRGELARGQRWNFRDALSLTAELVVGQWSDMGGEQHPCSWVHRNAQQAAVSSRGIAALVALARRLYPHALFRGNYLEPRVEEYRRQSSVDASAQPMSTALVAELSRDDEWSTKPIREILVRDYAKLDAAACTPSSPVHPLRVLEDAFSQSIGLGRASLPHVGLSNAETLILDCLGAAEAEWDVLGRDYAEATAAMCIIRNIAAIIAKRSIGVRLGHHGLDELLADYEAALRDTTRLGAVRDALQHLLGATGFQFNLAESFGQPQGEARPFISLESDRPGIRAFPAPAGTDSTPGHDVPCFEVTETRYRMPITFDFYMALRLRAEGCAGSSLPASVRAALDRVRQKYAGQLCRNREKFGDGRAVIAVDGNWRVSLQDAGANPTLAATT